MDKDRDALLRKLRATKPSARPTVQTMDVGLQHEVATCEGAETALGRYGAWPAMGPFVLSPAHLQRLHEARDTEHLQAALDSSPLQLLWISIQGMYDFQDFDSDQENEFEEELLRHLAKAPLVAGQDFYIYFDLYDAPSDLPVFFTSQAALIDHFMSFQSLTPWDQMSDEELKHWSEKLQESQEFALVSPDLEDEADIEGV